MPSSTPVISVGAKTRILVAEDHVDSREALRALFEAFGFDVVEARNGRQAVEAARQARPSLILMDVMMPEMDGVEAIRKLRETPETFEIPIIAVTAIDATRDALEAGADDVIRKPVDMRDLIYRVNRWLARGAH